MTRQRAARRRGFTLVLLAMLMFLIMGIAALVIDLGFARLSYTQMKSASSATAMEALSQTDVVAGDPASFAERTAATDAARRQAGVNRSAFIFDDDFDVAADTYNFGVGPNVTFTGGVDLGDGFHASQLLTVPGSPVYKPPLQTNLSNGSDGDFYATGDSMRVRYRRNGDAPVAGSQSNGGPIPYLFGRGSSFSRSQKASGVNLTVDTTAIARPAVRVGQKQTVGGVNIAGAIPVAIQESVWAGLPKNTNTTISLGVSSGGTLTATATTIGEPAAIQATPPTADNGYIAIVGTGQRVIGFGWAEVTPVDPTTFSVRKLISPSAELTIAAENATCRLSAAWDQLSSLSAVERQAVISANRAFVHPLAVAGLLD